MFIDDPTLQPDLRLALQLQRDELEEAKKKIKGKGREGETDDLVLAMQLYETELASYESVVSDRSMCWSIAQAVRSDAAVIGAMLQTENQDAADRELARRLSQGGNPSTATTSTTDPARSSSAMPPATVDDEVLARFEALYLPPTTDEHYPPAESSAWAATRTRPPLRTRERGAEQQQQQPKQDSGNDDDRMDDRPRSECVSCGDRHREDDMFRCPCSHLYCRACLASLFAASLSDESLFPPRCCGAAIPADDPGCRARLPAELAAEFAAKREELETADRTYCHRPACAAFIPPRRPHVDGEAATCARCGATTCVRCKGASHGRGDCPHDPATQELLRLAAENGWQRCYSCRRLVELHHGCNHMTCRCGAQFCYECGLRWKTCLCAQWNENRLLARAQAIVDRDGGGMGGGREPDDAGARARAGAARAARVDRELRNLVQNHECEHRAWRSRGGRHQCEECFDVLPLYIYECVRCRIMACRRCRFNRL